VKKIQSDRFSPARAFLPQSVALSGSNSGIRKRQENNCCLNFFPVIDGYSCQSGDEPYPGIIPGEISFVSALYFPDPHSEPERVVDYIGARVVSYGSKPDARAMFPGISAGFPVKGNFLEGTFYSDAYSSESWLWVLHGAWVIVCSAAHSATCPVQGPEDGDGEIMKILLDVAQAIAKHTIYLK
jgi:hypothetical protein